jgi:hypothetical protein
LGTGLKRPSLSHFAGVDIGGTKTALVLGESPGDDRIRILEKIVFPMDAGKSPAAILDGIGAALPVILGKHGIERDGIAGCEALLRDAALAVVAEESLRISRDACRIVPAGLGDALGDYAALAVAIHGPE